MVLLWWWVGGVCQGIRVSKRLWWSLLTNETIIWPCSPFLSVPGSVDWLQLGWCIGSSPHPYLQGTHCTKCCHDVQISSPCHVMLATSSSSSSSHLERKIAFESVFASWLPPILCFVAILHLCWVLLLWIFISGSNMVPGLMVPCCLRFHVFPLCQ